MIKKDLDKSKVIKALQKSDKDVGSSEVQIGILTERIKYLTEHFKKNKKDKHSNTGLSKLIIRRKKRCRRTRSEQFKQEKTRSHWRTAAWEK